MPECTKTYNAAGVVLACSGKHLMGNPFRDNGLVHKAEYMGISWTWYDSESDDA